MIVILLCFIFSLIALNLIQYIQRKNRDTHLDYLAEKLEQILERETMERLLLMTDDKKLQALLININKLLDKHQQEIAKYNQSRHSMKRMLTNISHDLKTPLTVVLGYIEMVQKDETIKQNEQERLLLQVHRKTVEIIDFMNAFFDLARLESGDKEIPLTKINVNEICKDNLLSFYDIVQLNGLTIDFQLPDDPIHVLGNKEALDRVLQNLLSNAIQYGSDGNILGLTLSVNEKHVYIEVWDKGKGIEEQKQDLVFERMFTLEESRNKAFYGSGLGLTITKRLLEQMNGTIHVQSIPYEKTVFTVALPRITY
ncbi:sensor histidine kinase [Ornithinibacillus bavariensis]|uniref:histidine kinase n=1 Tax=Ornithinibacillus bavariensis TaxID=545502 RepID=A0A919XAG3_9BACI|nr:sensor histidine kinase [Ornithinibacillus bavariensis]GIO28034.1 sensor histidine kinase YcbM [Ornithinibacillus bavariensis]